VQLWACSVRYRKEAAVQNCQWRENSKLTKQSVFWSFLTVNTTTWDINIGLSMRMPPDQLKV